MIARQIPIVALCAMMYWSSESKSAENSAAKHEGQVYSTSGAVRVMGDDRRAIDLATEEAELEARARLCDSLCPAKATSERKCELRQLQRTSARVNRTIEGLFVEVQLTTNSPPACIKN
jgi:hypothetical protein